MNKDSRKQFTQRFKFVKFIDIISVFPMRIGALCSIFLRIFKKNIWLICERKNEARDNGYWFYKYMCENHKEITAVYAINKKSSDYEKVKNLGKVISFGSLNHWIYYFAAKWNISSQKEGKPNAALCFVIEVYLGWRKNRAYIRHGITKDNQRWVYYDVTKMRLFVCSAKREYEDVLDKFGYPTENVKLLELCRFDNLLTPHQIKRQIVVMPTMREWLKTTSSDTKKYESCLDVSQSEYVITWNSFLNNKKLLDLLEKENVSIVFFPHSAMHKYLNLFKSGSSRIIIASFRDFDVQSLLMESSMLITDYSSVFFDFAYMKKPIAHYQFDYDVYRDGQYQEGYFSYENDGFGPVFKNENDLIDFIANEIDHSFSIEERFKTRYEGFFAFNDNKNCERTFDAIVNYIKEYQK